VELSGDEKLDECIIGMLHPTTGVKIKSITKRGQKFRAFSGHRLVKWLMAHMNVTAEEAVDYARKTLLCRGVFRNVPTATATFYGRRKEYFQFAFHDTFAPLNSCKYVLTDCVEPVELSQDLLNMGLSLLTSITAETLSFDQATTHPDYLHFCVRTAELQETDLNVMTPEERSAFYINVYNTLALHARFIMGVEPQREERSRLNDYCYIISQLPWCLSDIWDALRGQGDMGIEGCHPILSCLLFRGTDCCEPIRVYSAADFETRNLRSTMQPWLQRNVRVDWENAHMTVPAVLKKVRRDFGPREPQDLVLGLGYLLRNRELREAAGAISVLYSEDTYHHIVYASLNRSL